MKEVRWCTCGKKKIKTPSSYSGSPTDKSSFPPAPVLGRGNTGVPDSNAGSLSDLLMVPESGKKAPEGKVSFEGGEVGFLWNKKKASLRSVLCPPWKKVPSHR